MDSIQDIQLLIESFEISPKNPKRNLALLYYKLSVLYLRKRNIKEGRKANEKGKQLFLEIIDNIKDNFDSLENEELVNAIHTSISYSLYIDMDYVLHASEALLNNHQQYITPFIEADLYLKKGIVYNKKREFDVARQFIEKSISLFENVEHDDYKILALEELSQIHYMQGRYLDAIDIQKKILFIIPTEEINKRVTNYNLTGMYFLRLNNFHSALEQFTTANEIIKNNSNLFSSELLKNSQINIDSTLSKINENK